MEEYGDPGKFSYPSIFRIEFQGLLNLPPMFS